MPVGARRYPRRCMVVGGAIAALAWSAAFAEDPDAYLKSAQQHITEGNLKAAEIELRNAVINAPQGPVLRGTFCEVYMRLGNAASAEREARAARIRGQRGRFSARFWQTRRCAGAARRALN
jgi:Tfp pilus assembly protein PilF